MTDTNSKALHSIAIFEGIKGLTALIASLGLLNFLHHDMRPLAYALIGHFHLNPEDNLPKSFLTAIEWLDSGHITTVLKLAWAYGTLRVVEGYGLWHDRVWAEWLAALSGIVYLPLEIKHLLSHFSSINFGVLLLNFAVILYMVFRLWRRRKISNTSY